MKSKKPSSESQALENERVIGNKEQRFEGKCALQKEIRNASTLLRNNLRDLNWRENSKQKHHLLSNKENYLQILSMSIRGILCEDSLAALDRVRIMNFQQCLLDCFGVVSEHYSKCQDLAACTSSATGTTKESPSGAALIQEGNVTSPDGTARPLPSWTSPRTNWRTYRITFSPRYIEFP